MLRSTSSAQTGRLTRVLAACTLGLSIWALAGCQTAAGERPKGQPTPVVDDTISVSPEPAQTVAKPSGTPEVALVDTTPGGAQKSDPLWQALAKAAESGNPAYFKVYVHVGNPPAAKGSVTLTSDTPDSVSVTVDAAAVHKQKAAQFYLLQGTFDVSKTAESAYSLKTKSTDEIKGLNPSGPAAAERCSSDDAIDRIQQAADTLADNPSKREELRLQWAASPEVWWGIQLTAESLRDSNGDAAGDYLTEACEPYLPDDEGGEQGED
ncbi:hypothetical protein NQ038_10045 [Brevibacterium sp. 50QC2O2]|uniref:hypothetical protein n=1 Tax=Brevibacterium TaxID=1696 RepID=UPI00211BC82E|nr:MULTISPECIES: hypothetical protein [unclassified Brevibacterium]MCQ9367652.1 hypothetical protein [Brevibacterium sp. 91QC2O2]MCQ9385872.1 hypothetical protein [Brevibacterium sp. 68QC2CO]MCQ9388988.1 hypothetical protein [Brevibacterium sp. 50QC2O2]